MAQDANGKVDGIVCQSCSDRAGSIEWRGSVWCDRCFEIEATNRGKSERWVSRVLGTYDDGEYDGLLDADKIE